MPARTALVTRASPWFTPADPAEADDARCLRIRLSPRGATALPDPVDRMIGPHDELVYDVLPVASAGDRYASTAFVLDALLDDGTTIAGRGARDQHGTPLTAPAQAAAKRSWVDQWNRRIIDLTPFAGRRVIGLLVGSAADESIEVFLGDITIRRSSERPRDLLGWVDTRRGTHASDRFSRGNTAPVVSLPHGGVFGLPMTDAGAGDWPYRYRMSDPSIQAFATSHIPSPWIGDRGVFQLMPSPLAAPDTDRGARALPFAREDEHAGPDAYAVEFAEVGAIVTAAEHAIGCRFRSRSGALSIIVDHLGEAVDAAWHRDDGAMRLDVRLRDGSAPDHFVHAVLPPAERVSLAHDGGRLTGYVLIAGAEADVVVGVSTIDAEQARRNAEAPGGVERMRETARLAWHEVLGRLDIDDPDAVAPDTLRSIAGSLARLSVYPNMHDEQTPDGRAYRSPADGAVRPGRYTANNGFWDTYRTAWPLLGLLAPRTAGRLADGFVQHFTDAGWVARWSAPGPVDCMTGTTSDTVFAGLAAQGVPFDAGRAYRSALRHATLPASDARVGRKGIDTARFRGWVDTGVDEGLSWTLDNAINDASAARLASGLAASAGDDELADRLRAESAYLARRSLAYRDVFHPALGFFIGRTAHGAWRTDGSAFDPAEWGGDYTETNAWGTAFTAPHDGAGLAALHGGERALGDRLDAFFATPETADPAHSGSYGFVIHEMSEARDVRMGMLGLSNQPAHHIPFMYCFAGRHDDAHRIVVAARDRLFVGSEIGQGYPGDEDNGEMSAWYLFSVVGLYPLVPGSGEFVLTPPLLPRVTLRREGRDPLVIATRNPGAAHIRSVRIDGEPWERISLPWSVLDRARLVEFVLSDTPAGWAADTRPSSASAELGASEPLRDLLAPRRGTPADDIGRSPVRLTEGESVTLPLRREASVGLYTVTLAGAAAGFPLGSGRDIRASWRLDGVAPDGAAVSLDDRDETFEVAGQTRPFAIGSPASVTALRFTAGCELVLAQLEAFTP